LPQAKTITAAAAMHIRHRTDRVGTSKPKMFAAPAPARIQTAKSHDARNRP
jgi:hypothetical protein